MSANFDRSKKLVLGTVVVPPLIHKQSQMAKPHKSSLINGTYKHSANEELKMQLSIYYFEEDEFTIAYCPALDISGHGNDEASAYHDLTLMLSEYFRYTIHKKTIRKDLSNLGWVLKNSDHKRMIPPTDEEIMKVNENFQQIVSKYTVKKVSTPIQIPVFA
jgi:hypothetical protein